MDISEQLLAQLQDALSHLYDPDYQPPELLYALTGCSRQTGVVAIQSALIRGIKALAPEADTPRSAHTWLIYHVMHHRYVLKLTQEQTAEQLGISVRHLNRVQKECVLALARALWERDGRSDPGLAGEQKPESKWTETKESAQAENWRSQADRELAALQASAPAATCDVERVINGVLQLGQVIGSNYDVRIEAGFVQPGLLATIHPSILRQIIIAVLSRLVHHAAAQPIKLYASLEDGETKITIASAIAESRDVTSSSIVRDILVPDDAKVTALVENRFVFVEIKIPTSDFKTVLVADDNEDMIRFYRRCTDGTKYRIIECTSGHLLVDSARAENPDVILLDIMLPDIDGWELLMQLRQDSLTRSIPVVICSVVREEELAFSLGATKYLAKPIRRRALLEALAQVTERA